MMLQLLCLIPAFPFVSFLGLVLLGSRLSRPRVALIGVGSVGLSALVGILVAFSFVHAPPPGYVYTQTLWQWMTVASFTPKVAFHLDALSLVMLLVVTVVGFLIHLYAAEFMLKEEGYSRFFAYMNLFVGAMLTLVLADNLLLLYLGWEGVGLCSYLLIGFWYQDPANGYAAQKAFIVTRIGDTALAVGLFLLFTSLGTLDIQDVMQRASQAWPVGSGPALAAAALVLGGALGKSAQLPLQTWLPDAMAGPTPVSALIHAATMVTAGVYLIARTHVLFALAPAVQSAVAAIGALTLLLAGCSALTQRDIKRVLAYSTISQIGYMFLALGVGAWSAAIFHLLTHAFFKALLFLAAGSVILSLHHEHDIFRMGGLRRHLPLTFWTFLIGGAALAGLPLLTAGFYSKDWILWQAWAGTTGSPWLWVAGLLGTLLTSIYIFRVVFRVFYGPVITPISEKPGIRMQLALITLAMLSIVGGWLELPENLGHLPLFSGFLRTALPAAPTVHTEIGTEGTLQLIASGASVLGIALAYIVFLQRPRVVEAPTQTPWGTAIHRWWFGGWGFDRLYNRLIVEPFIWLAQVNKDDAIDAVYHSIARLHRLAHHYLRQTQTGKVRWYAAGIAAGSVVIIALAVWL
jgi:NADH-quinone oxidoreductase subunit L